MIEFNIFDSIAFITLTTFSLIAVDSIDFKRFLKASKPGQSFIFYILVSLGLSALGFTFYIYFKTVMLGM